uniref:NADH dehydrogenase subunit 4L n=1 Tax=Acerentomon microrhinus TaxID=996308 RepID=A0A0C4FST2_9HEXA|nr:NADH dehydrogenase subunit 4L [Acerentomon microrhinus]AFI54926.1 NADH dehydrogenase subunit 4L [Acerentomon microrhinus]
MLVFNFLIVLLFLNILMKYKHLIYIFLTLEFIILLTYNMIAIFKGSNMSYINFCLYYLILSVSESVMGLSILICVLRMESSDLFSSMNLAFYM